jgi:hypothetical protein
MGNREEVIYGNGVRTGNGRDFILFNVSKYRPNIIRREYV